MKLKKYRSTKNKVGEYNTQYIGKVIEINMINGSQNQDYLIQKR